MEIIQTLGNGTTIEFGEDFGGHYVHRICSPTGAMCRYAEPFHVALTYAAQYDEYYALKPEKTGETHEMQNKNS
jgi:hypothetical protein